MIELYTSPTPNGHKVSIALEEMRLDYELKLIRLAEGDQKRPSFLEKSPNARIPAIVDTDNGDFNVFESGAILLYLAEKTGQFMPADPVGRSLVQQWLMWQMAGVGPMMGQTFVFTSYFPEKLPAVISRYQNETRRLLGVLDTRLARSPYMAGPFSIADMATWPWVRLTHRLDIDIEEFPHVQRWIDELAQRPAFRRGIERPPMLPDEERIEAGQSIVQT